MHTAFADTSLEVASDSQHLQAAGHQLPRVYVRLIRVVWDVSGVCCVCAQSLEEFGVDGYC